MDLHEIAQVLAPKGAGLRLRQCVVASWSAPYAVVTIGGSDVHVTNVKSLASYTPAAADVAWLITDGVDMLLLGKLHA